MRLRPRNVCLAGLALLLASSGLAATPALGKKKAPSLVVSRAHLKSAPYGFIDEAGHVRFTDVTENVGNARAGRTSTEVLFTHRNVVRRVASRPVRRLAPGQKQLGETFVRLPGSLGLVPGAYRMFVCPDATGKV